MTTADYKIKVSALPPTTLRLQPELLDRLKREAAINNRSLSQEAEYRLKTSFSYPATPPVVSVSAGDGFSPRADVSQAHVGAALTEAQRQLLALFDGMSPEKQGALLTVLKKN